MVTRLGQFKKLKCKEGSWLCKLSQLCYHFFRVLKMKIIFKKYPLLSPVLRHTEFLDQSVIPKKLRLHDIFSNKISILNRDIHPVGLFVCALRCLFLGLSLAIKSRDQFPALSLVSLSQPLAFFWTLFMENFCGHFLWTRFVDSFLDTFSGD